MPYTDHPTNQTIRSAVIENFVSTIRAIAPPSFANTFKTVESYGANILANGSKLASPACIITPLDERIQEWSSVVDRDLTVEVLIGYEGNDWRERILTLLADVSQAVRNTYTRGGRAIWTNEIERTVFDAPTPTATTGNARLLFEVRYRVQRNDETLN